MIVPMQHTAIVFTKSAVSYQYQKAGYHAAKRRCSGGFSWNFYGGFTATAVNNSVRRLNLALVTYEWVYVTVASWWCVKQNRRRRRRQHWATARSGSGLERREREAATTERVCTTSGSGSTRTDALSAPSLDWLLSFPENRTSRRQLHLLNPNRLFT